MAASIALHSCQTVVGHYVQVLQRNSTDQFSKCTVCSSRNIRTHFDLEIPPDGQYFSSCGSCDWNNRPDIDNE
jgi:hypothetical protein